MRRGLVALAALLSAPLPAWAQPSAERGVDVQLFGGVVGFPGEAEVNAGAAYGVSASFPYSRVLRLEVGYQGGAYTERIEGRDESVAALENGGYLLLRYSPSSAVVRPYALAGLGISHINAVDQLSEEGALQDDTIARLPVGLGVDISVESFLVGVRGIYAFVFANDHALRTTSRRGADQLFGTFHLGVEF